MSGIAKGIKKVFKKVVKGVKKLFKSKVFKVALIAAATFFTAGMATGGFSGLATAFKAKGLFGAIGTTIKAGFQASMGSLGLSSGVSSSVANTMGIAEGTTLGTGALTTSVKGMFGAGGSAAGGGSVGAKGAFWDKIAGAGGKFGAQAAAGGAGGGSSILGSLASFAKSPAGMYLGGQMLQGYMGQKAQQEAWRNMTYYGIQNNGNNQSSALMEQIRQGNPFAFASPTAQQAVNPQQNRPAAVPQYMQVPYSDEQYQGA